MSVIKFPLINPPFIPLITPPAADTQLIHTAARANNTVHLKRTLFSSPCHSPSNRQAYLNQQASSTKPEVHAGEENTPAPASEYVPNPLGSPIRSSSENTVAVAVLAPHTPQQQQRKRSFTGNSPSTPLSSPEARKKFGEIASPLWTHDASQFNKRPRNSQEKMTLKRTLAKIEKKPVHTWEVASPTKSTTIRTKPDKEGRLKHKGRYYRLHEPKVDAQKPEAQKTNRIIPAVGSFFIRQPGIMSGKMAADYLKSPLNEPFNAYLTRECSELFKTLHPTSKQALETTGLDFIDA